LKRYTGLRRAKSSVVSSRRSVKRRRNSSKAAIPPVARSNSRYKTTLGQRRATSLYAFTAVGSRPGRRASRPGNVSSQVRKSLDRCTKTLCRPLGKKEDHVAVWACTWEMEPVRRVDSKGCTVRRVPTLLSSRPGVLEAAGTAVAWVGRERSDARLKGKSGRGSLQTETVIAFHGRRSSLRRIRAV